MLTFDRRPRIAGLGPRNEPIVKPSTELIRRPEGTHEDPAPLTTPIYETTTFVFESAAQVQAYNEGRSRKYLYSRYANPTVTAVERTIAALERAEAALLLASGQAATTTTLMALLEPQAPDALVAWGEFNTAFERKEYMEDYVAEDVARDMLAKDPALKAQFGQRLKDDAGFASNPSARLEFFARRHSSWDTAYNVYPVLRIDRTP